MPVAKPRAVSAVGLQGIDGALGDLVDLPGGID
jgi:hypothetical protein